MKKLLILVLILAMLLPVAVSCSAELDENEIERYINTDDPYDKAGAYAIQGFASLWINKIDGDYFNVVGLPVKKVSDLLLQSFGFGLSGFIE